ncbi:hypothetical protein ACFTTN_04970 [Streptomyces niveus]|uniref:hypothetical protein n=1 Tax=Streptomyces niveus TaxID=193462 RepID=UPI0036436D0E
MDEQLTALATAAATTVMNSLATDAWERVRTLVGQLWHRPEQVAAVEEQLGDARELLLSPAHEDDALDLAAAWRLRFRQLLATDETAAQALAEIVAELTAEAGEDGKQGWEAPRSLEMRAQASGDAQVYQSGRDMTNIRLP